jgi:hypothetical protein
MAGRQNALSCEAMKESSRKVTSAGSQRAPASAPKAAPRAHVLPDEIPTPVVHVLRQVLQINSLVSGFTWVMDRIAEANPIELAEHFVERYEQQILRLKGDMIKPYLPVFRVGLSVKCLEILPLFSMHMAQAGFNPLFLRIWFQKRLLSNLIGISVADIERRARASGLKMSDHLNDQIARLYPQTSVARHLGRK